MKREKRFFGNGKDGTIEEFEIKYTFSVEPLHQYLVPFEDGCLQALSIAWDSRPASEGDSAGSTCISPLAILERTLENTPEDQQLLWALAIFSLQHHELDQALPYARRLAGLAPDADRVKTLLEEIGATQASP